MKKLMLLVCVLCLSYTAISQTDGKIYDSSEIDTAPVFAEGKMTLADFLKFYQKTPQLAVNEINSGTVILKLILSSDGDIVNSSISSGVNSAFDKEALRLAELMPRFSPATKNGNSVSTRISLNIPFIQSEVLTNVNTPQVGTSTETTMDSKKYPLYVIDGKIVNEDIKVNADNIESVRVLKGKKAIERYGERAADGVIIFTTKNTSLE